MTKRAQLADGTVLEFPDDTPDEIMDNVVRQHVNPAPKDDSRVRGVLAGMLKPLDNAAEAFSNIPVIGPAMDRAGQAMGMLSTQQAVEQNDAMRRNNSRTGYQLAGNVIGTLPLARLGGGAVVQGGLSGAALTDKKDLGGIAFDAGLGGLASKGVSTLMRGAGAALNPVVSKGQQALYDAGIPQTLGQIASQGKGLLSRAVTGTENALAKLPFGKEVVTAARDRGAVGYYETVVKRTGVPIPAGTEAGHETHDYIARKLSDRYQSLLPKLNIAPDPKIKAGLGKVEAGLKGRAPASTVKQFTNIMETAGLRGTAGGITGTKLQHADKVLRVEAERFGKSQNPNDKLMAEGFQQIREQLRGLAMRQNPKHAGELSQLNKQWRELALIRKAAGDPNAGSGIFSPAQYSRAAKGSRSNAQLTRAANQTLTARSPDSGTSQGVGMGALLAGSGALGATVNPVAGATLGGMSLLYTKPGQKALNAAVFAPRPAAVKKAGQVFKSGSRLAPVIVPPMLAAPE